MRWKSISLTFGRIAIVYVNWWSFLYSFYSFPEVRLNVVWKEITRKLLLSWDKGAAKVIHKNIIIFLQMKQEYALRKQSSLKYIFWGRYSSWWQFWLQQESNGLFLFLSCFFPLWPIFSIQNLEGSRHRSTIVVYLLQFVQWIMLNCPRNEINLMDSSES